MRDGRVLAPDDLGRLARAGDDAGERHLVLRDPFGNHLAPALAHGDGHLARLPDHVELLRALDHAHPRDDRGRVDRLGNAVAGPQVIGDHGRNVGALHRQGDAPGAAAEHLVERVAPLVPDAVGKGLQVLDPGHRAGHERFGLRRDQRHLAARRDRDHRRPAELKTEITPIGGVVVDGIDVREQHQIDALVRHAPLKFLGPSLKQGQEIPFAPQDNRAVRHRSPLLWTYKLSMSYIHLREDRRQGGREGARDEGRPRIEAQEVRHGTRHTRRSIHPARGALRWRNPLAGPSSGSSSFPPIWSWRRTSSDSPPRASARASRG